MPARDPLSDAAIQADLPDGWSLVADADGSRIARTYRFGDFRTAMAFLVRMAFEAEAMDHHPELTNVYDRVEIALTTHDAGNRVTETDLVLARRLHGLARGFASAAGS